MAASICRGLQRALPLNFSSELSSLGIGFQFHRSNCNLGRRHWTLDFSFGVDLTPGLSSSNAFFIKVNDLSASAERSLPVSRRPPADSDSKEREVVTTAERRSTAETTTAEMMTVADSGRPSRCRNQRRSCMLDSSTQALSTARSIWRPRFRLKVNNPDGDPDGHITMAELTGTPISAPRITLNAHGFTLDATFARSRYLGGLHRARPARDRHQR